MGAKKAKASEAELLEVRIYKLRKDDEMIYAGRAMLPVERCEVCETVGASSRMYWTKVRVVRIGERIYKLEKEGKHPAIFLPPGDTAPKGML